MTKSISELIMDYFKQNPKKDLKHGPVVEFVDEYGNTLDVYQVQDIHVEIKRDNIEPLTRVHKPTLRAGCFYAN